MLLCPGMIPGVGGKNALETGVLRDHNSAKTTTGMVSGCSEQTSYGGRGGKM